MIFNDERWMKHEIFSDEGNRKLPKRLNDQVTVKVG